MFELGCVLPFVVVCGQLIRGMPLGFDGKTAVVTGASSGIGRAIASALGASGADLVLHARANRAGLEQVSDEVRAQGRKVTNVLADLSSVAACEQLVQQATEHRPVDIWIHCAGADVLTGAGAEQSFEQKLERLWQVDVRGMITCCRIVGDQMRLQGSGVILTIGWDQAETGMEGDSGQMFCATKGAVAAFTKSLAKSLSPEVRVNCLAPGWIETSWGAAAPAAWRQRAVQESLLRRWGTPEDVASMAIHLTSPNASFITGQVIAINGGFAGSRPPCSDPHG